MEIRKIQKSDYQNIEVLYTGAFPANERAPFRLLRKRAEQGRFLDNKRRRKKHRFGLSCDL